MFAVETYAAVRKFVFTEGNSRREAARVFGLSRDTVAKMCRYAAPPGHVRTKPAERPKLGSLVPVIDAILEADRSTPPKQRHTAKRIFERLRDEHGFLGGYTVVKDYVRLARSRSREVFIPLAHPPGHAQVDFGECVGVIGGVAMKLHVFCFDLPQSDACFLKAYAAETTEAFLDGHVSAFAFFGGVPLSILYDNLKIAVAKILGDGARNRTQAFTELVSHFLFADRFGRPGKGNDKEKVEGLVKFMRLNYLTPLPHAPSIDALNARLLERCLARQNDRAGRHEQTIGERLAADKAAFRELPAMAFEACHKVASRVSSQALVRYRTNDYSVPTRYGYRDVLVQGFAVIQEAYIQGVSTRSVDDLVKAMGMSGVSKSQVSRLCEEIDERVKAFLGRPIEGDWPYLWIDATYVKVRQNGRIVSMAVIVAVGVNADGRREVLGMDIGVSEAETFWTEFLRKLRRRGLRGVKLVVSGLSGISCVTGQNGMKEIPYGPTQGTEDTGRTA